MKTLLIFIAFCFTPSIVAQYADGSEPVKTFHQVLSWTPPLEKYQDQVMNSWTTKASSVFLNNRLVLAPAGAGTDQYGLLKQKYTFASTDWEMNIDFSTEQPDYFEGGKAGSSLNMYFLAHAPNADRNENWSAFGLGNLGNFVQGAMIKVVPYKVQNKGNSEGAIKDQDSTYTISLSLYDDRNKLVNKPMHDRCRASFKRAVFKIASEKDAGLVSVLVKQDNSKSWITCIQSDKMTLDFNLHTYIATGGRERLRASHYINSIEFYDMEDEIPAEQEQAEWQQMQGETARLFDAEGAPDLLHMGNIDGAILQNADLARGAYNDELLKYNSKFAQLVAKLSANQQQVDAFLAELPDTEELNKLQQEIYSFRIAQEQFISHYHGIQANIKSTVERFNDIASGSPSNPNGKTNNAKLLEEVGNVLYQVSQLEGQINRTRTTSVADNKVSKAIREKVRGNEPTRQDKKERNPKMEKNRLQSLKRIMNLEINKITDDDIRGTDLDTDFTMGIALVVIALVGAFVYYQLKNSERSLPMTAKNRLD